MNNALTEQLFNGVKQKYSRTEELVEWSRIVEEGLTPYEEHYIKKHVNSSRLLLNIGCGGGRESIALASRGYKIIGIDLLPSMVSNARQNALKLNMEINFLAMNAFDLGFSNESFAGVLMLSQVLAFIPFRKNRIHALKEVYRILKPGGKLILTTHSLNSNIKYQAYFFIVNSYRRLFNRIGLNRLEPGDRFARTVGKAKSKGKHYLHMYSMEETFDDLSAAGFKVLSCHSRNEIIEKKENASEREKDYYLIYAASKQL
jgi:ubiquinone/menaquinone biosynthesis C-methylase UbiE